MKNNFNFDEYVRVPMKLVRHPEITGAEKLIAIALVFLLEERKMHPSLNILMHYSGLSKPSVVSAIKGLEEKNLIEVERESTKINQYKLYFH